MKNYNKVINILTIFFLSTFLTSLSGCGEVENKIELDAPKLSSLSLEKKENKLAKIIISKDSSSLFFPIFVPEEIEESAMTFLIKSEYKDLIIELFDPKNNLIKSNNSNETYFSPSEKQFSNLNQWNFDKVINPTSGKWIIKFSRKNKKIAKDISLILSIGLFPKYSAWIIPYEKEVKIGQPNMIELNFSKYGIPSEIEGHMIEIFNSENKKIDQKNVTNHLKRADGQIINISKQQYLQYYTPKEIGTHTLKSEFKFRIDGRSKIKIIENKFEVFESEIELINWTIIVSDEVGYGAVIKVKVLTKFPIFLVTNIVYSRNGKNATVSRNKNMKSGEIFEFLLPIRNITQKEINEKTIEIKNLYFVNFDAHAKIILEIPINKFVEKAN